MPNSASTTKDNAHESMWPAPAWLAWAFACAAVVQIAPSPAYVALIVAISWLVVETHGRSTPLAMAYPVILGLGAGLAMFRVAIAAATAHGSGSVLFSTPSFTVPRLLGGFTVGGPVDTTVVAMAASEAFAVLGIIAVFGAFNSVVSHYELIQSAPRAFHELGVVVVLALAVVPSTITAITASGEASRARTGGAPVRGRRVLRRVMPLLETGLERATGLAESMDSRGFARSSTGRADQAAAWLGLAALLLAGCALVALVGRAQLAGALFGGAAAVAVASAVAAASAGSRRRLYRPRKLGRLDWALIGLVALAPTSIAAVAIFDLPGAESLRWPADQITWPDFAVLPGLAAVLLLAPLIRSPERPS